MPREIITLQLGQCGNQKMATPSKKPDTKIVKYSNEAMLAACKAVTENKKGLREAARLFKVPPSTLRDRLGGRKAYSEIERTVITSQEEERLVEWINESARRGFGRTMGHVQRAVQSILNERKAVTIFRDNLPGKKWTSLFLGRHPDVSLQAPRALEAHRAVISKVKLMAWFKTAYKEIREAGGDVLDHPSRIFNCGETGFQLSGGGFTKIFSCKGDSKVYQVSKDTHTQITVLVCASASGEVHKPVIIFPGQRFSYDPIEGFPGAHFGKSHNGTMDAEIFTAWLRTVFIHATKDLEKPIVLFADGHRTHMTLAMSELCRDHGIILYQLPSHVNHFVKPLDLTTFGDLQQVWREEVLKFQEENYDTVGKKAFGGVLKKAWERGIKRDTVISEFRAAGLYPWNPNYVDKQGPSKLNVTNQTETVQTEDLTETDIVAIASISTTVETASTVPGETRTETLTTSANNTVTNATLSSSMDHEDLPIDPPSPTVYPSALPPLSPSLESPSSHATSTPVTAISSPSNDIRKFYLETRFALDRLLDLVAKAGVDKLIHYRTLHALGTVTDDPEQQLFFQLYSRLTEPENDKVGLGRTKTTVTFDSLSLPSQWMSKPRKRLHAQTKMISSDVCRQHVTDMDEQKRKLEEEKEKKERKEKKKKTEEQIEKKEQEKRKKECEEKESRKKKRHKQKK